MHSFSAESDDVSSLSLLAINRQTSGGSRGGAGGPPPPLFLDQNEARRVEKFFLETAPPFPTVWMAQPIKIGVNNSPPKENVPLVVLYF